MLAWDPPSIIFYGSILNKFFLHHCSTTNNQVTAIKGDDAKADIKARGFWRRGVDAYFDVSFANVNAESYKDLDTATIFAKREKSKKRGSLLG